VRAAIVVAGLAFFGTLAILPELEHVGPGGRAEAADCAWQRHTKRVVKHVRRHGQERRVARRKHWWSCSAVPTPPASSPPPASPPPTPPVPAPEPEATGNRLGIKAHEYVYELSRPNVAAGEVTVELNNQGEDAHNLNLQLESGAEEPIYTISETASRQRKTERFDLPAGTYRLWCSLPTHEEEGMQATLVVGGG
jgi:plastocyanin